MDYQVLVIQKTFVLFDYAVDKGLNAWLINYQEPKILGKCNLIKLDVNEYHTSESCLYLFFINHGAGFACPTIKQSVRRIYNDYKQILLK